MLLEVNFQAVRTLRSGSVHEVACRPTPDVRPCRCATGPYGKPPVTKVQDRSASKNRLPVSSRSCGPAVDPEPSTETQTWPPWNGRSPLGCGTWKRRRLGSFLGQYMAGRAGHCAERWR